MAAVTQIMSLYLLYLFFGIILLFGEWLHEKKKPFVNIGLQGSIPMVYMEIESGKNYWQISIIWGDCQKRDDHILI